MTDTVIIGVGNQFRGDDGLGLAAARQLRSLLPPAIGVHESNGEALSMMELWKDAACAIIVDASEPRGNPGSVVRLDASSNPIASIELHASTHAFSVAEAIEMARSLGCLPGMAIVYAVEGKDFEHGEGLSLEARKGVEEVIECIQKETTN